MTYSSIRILPQERVLEVVPETGPLYEVVNALLGRQGRIGAEILGLKNQSFIAKCFSGTHQSPILKMVETEFLF
jgi:hypothetical protein